MWHAGQMQPADMPLGLHEVINIFEPIYTDREISHRKSNFLASLEKLKALALWGPHSYLIMVVLRHGCLLGWSVPMPTHRGPIPPYRLTEAPLLICFLPILWQRQHSTQHVRAKLGPEADVPEKQNSGTSEGLLFLALLESSQTCPLSLTLP